MPDKNFTYSDYLQFNKTILLLRNWIKNKNALIDNPCISEGHSLYQLAKTVDRKKTMQKFMPEVFFDDEYSFYQYESWEDIYLNKDLFISTYYSNELKHKAFSLETVYLTNKHKGFLRTSLRFDDLKLTPMSDRDQKRFITQLETRYPSYYMEYLSITQPNNKESNARSIDDNTLNVILNSLELMIVMSCHKGGLNNTFLPGSLTDSLSAFGYQIFIETLEINLNESQLAAVKSMYVKNIRTGAEKTIDEIIDSAFHGACTTSLSLYWLGLLQEYRHHPTFQFNDNLVEMITNKIIENNPKENSYLNKHLLSHYLRENHYYIVFNLLSPIEEPIHSSREVAP